MSGLLWFWAKVIGSVVALLLLAIVAYVIELFIAGWNDELPYKRVNFDEEDPPN